jgi:very-short-patch-repair endonuclease
VIAEKTMYTDDTKQLFNHSRYKQRRALLRLTQTKPEELLWQKIRHKQMGVKFRRQHGIGDYIVDFYCAEHALVIELDGDSHFTSDAREYDKVRDQFLLGRGLRVLRCTNRQVVDELEMVLEEIRRNLTPS